MTEITVEKPEEPTEFVRVLQVIEAINRVAFMLTPVVTRNIAIAYAVWMHEGRPAQFVSVEDDNLTPKTLADLRQQFGNLASACVDVLALVEPFVAAPVDAGGELPAGVPFVN